MSVRVCVLRVPVFPLRVTVSRCAVVFVRVFGIRWFTMRVRSVSVRSAVSFCVASVAKMRSDSQSRLLLNGWRGSGRCGSQSGRLLNVELELEEGVDGRSVRLDGRQSNSGSSEGCALA